MKFNSNLQYSNKKLVRASVETFYPNYNNVTALQQVLTSQHDITSTKTFVTKDTDTFNWNVDEELSYC